MTRESCMFCDSPLNFRVIVPCNHNELCLQCYIRNVVCYNNLQCGYCTNDYTSDPIATTNLALTNYSDARAQNSLRHSSDYRLYFNNNSIMNEIIQNYMSFRCSKCGFHSKSQDDFSSHLKNEHQLFLCFICINSHRFLPCEAVSYQANEFAEHKKHHPCCPCCQYYAFDIKELEKHMNDRHVRCDICLSKFNKVIWMKNENCLQNHYSRDHYICHYQTCIDSLIAFATEVELMRHLTSEHHESVNMTGLTLICDPSYLQMQNESDEEERRNRITQLNHKFIQKLTSVFAHDHGKINELKAAARRLISDQMQVHDFYRLFCEICGENKNRVFTDMVAIMPDPQKRAELLRLSENVELKKQPLPQQTKTVSFKTKSPPIQRISSGQKANMTKSTSMPSVANHPQIDDDDENEEIRGRREDESEGITFGRGGHMQMRTRQQQQPKQSNQPKGTKKRPKKIVITTC